MKVFKALGLVEVLGSADAVLAVDRMGKWNFRHGIRNAAVIQRYLSAAMWRL